jgi:hypothetical protein
VEVWNDIKNLLFRVALVILVLTLAWRFLPIGRDSTDGEYRSGMALRIDALTGCHYLEGSRGGITPRVTANGTHICTGPEY